MSRDQFIFFRDILLDTREDILTRIKELEARWQELSERQIEIEEGAQNAALTLPYDRLDGNGKETIEQIDLALNKIITGDYGICENCGDGISIKRLEAVPWTRLCIDCARASERGNLPPPPAEATQPAELPDEYQGLANDQVPLIIHEELEEDLFEAGDDKPYHPPNAPPPHELPRDF